MIRIQLKQSLRLILKALKHLPECDGLTIYLSDKFISTTVNNKNNYFIVAPTGSYASCGQMKTHTNLYPVTIVTSSLSSPVNVEDKGRSIRVTKTGLRFGFSWNEIPEIENLASDIEYGFILSLQL